MEELRSLQIDIGIRMLEDNMDRKVAFAFGARIGGSIALHSAHSWESLSIGTRVLISSHS